MTFVKILTILVVLVLGGVAIYIMASRSIAHAPSTTPTSTTSTTPAQSTSSSQVQGGNIIVSAPSPDQKITSPANISGQARVFENVVSYRVVDSSGKILASGNTTAKASKTGDYSDFSISVTFPTPTTSDGKVEVYQVSAKDGSEIDKVSIPVKFK